MKFPIGLLNPLKRENDALKAKVELSRKEKVTLQADLVEMVQKNDALNKENQRLRLEIDEFKRKHEKIEDLSDSDTIAESLSETSNLSKDDDLMFSRPDASFHSESTRDQAMRTSPHGDINYKDLLESHMYYGFDKNSNIIDEDTDRNFFQRFFGRIRNFFRRD